MRRIKDHEKRAKVRCLAIHPRSTKVLVLNSTLPVSYNIIPVLKCIYAYRSTTRVFMHTSLLLQCNYKLTVLNRIITILTNRQQYFRTHYFAWRVLFCTGNADKKVEKLKSQYLSKYLAVFAHLLRS